jgi:hypothetical protein
VSNGWTTFHYYLAESRSCVSVRTAGSGLKIDITGVSPDRGAYRVHVHR